MADRSNEPMDEAALLRLENARLRSQMARMGILPEHANFDPQAFQRALTYYTRIYFIPLYLLVMIVFLAKPLLFTTATGPFSLKIGPVPVFDIGATLGLPGMGCGLIAFGGMAFGGIAIGGGAVGLVAFGGGAIGIIAIGGGALGYYTAGGGGFGYYVLGGSGTGKHVFSMRRQDRVAVEFWTRLLPRLKASIQSPMPVIPVDDLQLHS